MMKSFSLGNLYVPEEVHHDWPESFVKLLSCLYDWLSEWLLLGVGETDEEVAKRLQASFDTEAGTDSHAAVRAGARPSQAVPPNPQTQMSGTAPVRHLATLTTGPFVHIPQSILAAAHNVHRIMQQTSTDCAGQTGAPAIGGIPSNSSSAQPQ